MTHVTSELVLDILLKGNTVVFIDCLYKLNCVLYVAVQIRYTNYKFLCVIIYKIVMHMVSPSQKFR